MNLFWFVLDLLKDLFDKQSRKPVEHTPSFEFEWSEQSIKGTVRRNLWWGLK